MVLAASASTSPTGPAPVVLAESPNPKWDKDHYGPVHPKVAVPIDLARKLQYENRWVAILNVYSFDEASGAGCPECGFTGQIGVYQRRDIDPYILMGPCPHCYKPD